MKAQGKTKLSRRDFLQLIGLSAGVAAVGVAAKPVANTELANNPDFAYKPFSDPAGRPQRPWWVKTVDKPTVEIDWNKMQRFNERDGSVRGPGMAHYVGQDRVDQLNAQSAKVLEDKIKNNVPGYTLKDQALNSAQGDSARLAMSFLGPQKAKTPEEWGVPKWHGTPEEAAKMLRAAFRHLGVGTVGFFELDDNTRKLIYSVDPDGKQLVFTDDDQPSETDSTRYIPKKAKYAIAFTIQMSEETLKRAPTPLGQQTTGLSYKRHTQIQASMQEFLRGLGYMGLGEQANNALGIAPAFGVMAGLGELSRLNRLITPEFGPMTRVFKMLTDLPVATDKPIDFGVMRFCRTCKKCAENCGGKALSFDTEPTWNVRGGWNNPGHKAYFEDSTKCYTYWKTVVGTNCGICFAVCPFAKKDKAWIHNLVKATDSTTPVFDGFMRRMDDAFGYGLKDPTTWWDLDLPELGHDSTIKV